mmetsp:Transcript_32535/g.74336  ORF Transcript_32535/g.74336 Transcript_32535/m.74336 type:complete len:476 (+) Transcript_32535:62-1489(+)
MLASCTTAFGWLAALGGVFCANGLSFTVYSDPIELRYGQVYNTIQSEGGYAAHSLPKEVVERYASGEKKMAVRNFTMDMIRVASDGTETPVLLSDHYLHHYILHFGESRAMQEMMDMASEDETMLRMLSGCHGMRGMGAVMFQRHLLETGRDPHLVAFGSAAGAEYRHNPQTLFAPYALVLTKPTVFLPEFHIINTKDDPATVSKLLECPCTPQRKIDVEHGLIDGKEPHPKFGCSAEFAASGNPSCNLSTYVGGWRCCEHKVFVIDTAKECKLPGCVEKPVDKVFMKFNFEYEDASEETRTIEPASCCDTTTDSQGFGNIEHDVLPCDHMDGEECTFVTETVQPLAYYSTRPRLGPQPSDLVDLVYAAPHLHWAGTSMELIDDVTNKTICKVERQKDNEGGIVYGTGKDAGDELGYLVGLAPCMWDTKNASRFRRDHPMRARSVYDASEYHMGVMSLWLAHVAAVPEFETEIHV